jgi:regulator of protease activity HflC (stomatin/prohibitin superfamily)
MDQYPGQAEQYAGGATARHDALLFHAVLGFVLAALPLLGVPLMLRTVPALSSVAGVLLLTAASMAATLLLRLTRAGRIRRQPWTQPTLAIGAGCLAALIVLSAWHAPTPSAPTTLLATGSVLLVLAFPVLVLERSLADAGIADAAILRAVLLVQAGFGLALILQGSGVTTAVLLPPVLAGGVLLLAVEFAVRGLVSLFLPPPDLVTARPVARSALAGWIRLRPPRLALINQAISQRWGLDLSRGWALRFVGRALLPIGLLLALLAWGLTGLIALPLDQRAVFELFGRPVAVLGPGLHLLPPWPIGIARRVENGVLHELALGEPDRTRRPAALPSAEDTPPQSADRLWDRPHAGETTYLIASPAATGQGFQRVDVDLRLVTRIGLSNTAAIQAAYGVSDPDALVRAVAGRILVAYFSARTLAGVLGEDRGTFTETIRAALQQEFDRLDTGIEIVAVVTEAIHPPPETAEAWHNVQSAGIRAQVAVADENGAAAKTAAAARTTVAGLTGAAIADAAEAVAKANADATLFGADRAANAASPEAFQLERWLMRLRAALPRAQLLLLDHRLAGAEAPTLDLRDLAPRTPP